jgi:hypothetical protein
LLLFFSSHASTYLVFLYSWEFGFPLGLGLSFGMEFRMYLLSAFLFAFLIFFFSSLVLQTKARRGRTNSLLLQRPPLEPLFYSGQNSHWTTTWTSDSDFLLDLILRITGAMFTERPLFEWTNPGPHYLDLLTGRSGLLLLDFYLDLSLWTSYPWTSL